MRPSSTSWSRRDFRTATMANSVATKNPFASTSTAIDDTPSTTAQSIGGIVTRTVSACSAAPGRQVGPAAQGLARPRRGLVGVAARARIRHLEIVCQLGADECEGVAAHVHVRDGLLDLRHVAGHAVAAG